MLYSVKLTDVHVVLDWVTFGCHGFPFVSAKAVHCLFLFAFFACAAHCVLQLHMQGL